jgi:hypothetical protein
MLFSMYPLALFAQSVQVLDGAQATQTLVVQNLKIENGNISGELVNKSPHPIRDIELLIRHTWAWKNEFRPGTDDPGVGVYHKVEKEIPPGGRASFSHKLSEPLEARPDGAFDTTVSVAGFATVLPQ